MAKGLSQEFGDVLESGFGRHIIKRLLKMIDQVSIQEIEAEDLKDALISQIFEVKDKMKPVDVAFWYEIFEWIVDLADYSKKQSTAYV